MEEAKTKLFLERARLLARYGTAIYALYSIPDYFTFRDWTVVWIRLSAAALVLLTLSPLCSAWGKRHVALISTLAMFVGYAGFEAIVCYKDAYGSVYEEALDLFLGAYCVLLPVTTSFAIFAGVSMFLMSLGSEAIFKHRVPIDLGISIATDSGAIALFVFVRYVTNRSWEAEFNAKADAIQSERMAVIGRLTGEVAHELNNPLHLIALNLSSIQRTLAESHPPEALRLAVEEDLLLIRTGVDQAAGVVRDLRQLGILMRREGSMTDVNDVLNTAVSLINGPAKRSGIVIHRDYGILPKTWCNPQGLSQVFVNVLQNACQAVKPEGNVWVKSTGGEDTITISVCDDGEGVPVESLGRVFEPYFTTKEGSTGIGLAVCRRIIDGYGGTIEVANRPSGLEVTLSLPIRSH